MSKILFLLILVNFKLFSAPYFPPQSSFTDQDIQRVVTFLTEQGNVQGDGGLGSIGTNCGVAYTALNTLFPSNTLLPLSFYSSPAYWQYYVGQNSASLLNVTDIYNSPPGNYNLSPTPICTNTAPFPTLLCPGNLQIERVNAFVGTDIYDAAVWQIALALAGKAGFTGPNSQSLFSILSGQTTLLQLGSYGGNYGGPYAAGALRAPSSCGPFFTYGYQNIFIAANPSINSQNAYMIRSIPPNFINTDPIFFLSGTQFIASDVSNPNPLPAPYFQGAVTWQDFKPITGENGWALFLGPLQSSLLQQQSQGNQYVSFSSAAIQNAIRALPAFQAMQSPIGVVYYVVNGSLGNTGTVNPYTVALENNFSLLGGLFTLKKILTDELTYQPGLSQSIINQINTSLGIIQIMIYGGVSNGVPTEGIIPFFQKYGWDASSGTFYSGGTANDPTLQTIWVPNNNPKAVDVGTWGVSCLGQPLIDSWFGFGTAYNIWQNVKGFGGFYGPDGTLWGVGYSNLDGNGSPGSYLTGINSGEWTAGAINMVRVLISQYGKVAIDSTHYTVDQRNAALAYVASLSLDESTMSAGVLTLSTDNYATNSAYTNFVPSVTNPSALNYNQLLFNSLTPPSDRLAFLYASKRYAIPFGWNSNPIPSIASTGWIVYNYYNFNPFNPIGTYDVNPELNVLPPVIPVSSIQHAQTIKTQKVDQAKNLLH